MTMKIDLKMDFTWMTPRTTLMPVRGRATSLRFVANPISVPCKITITPSWKLLTMLVYFSQLLTKLLYVLQAQSTLLLLLADFHPLLCFKKVKTSPPGHLQPLRSLPLPPARSPHLQPLRPLPLPLVHSPHLRKQNVRVWRPLQMKTELRLKSLPPLQVRNMLGRWQNMHNGWLS
jgi:hypothetical protein